MARLKDEFEIEVIGNVAVDPELEGLDDQEQEDAPEYGSEGWSSYVMSLFHEDEMIDGNPLCPGLRRVANLLLGSVVSSKPVQVFPSLDPDGVGRATVVYEITFDWGNTGDFRTFGDVGEVWHGNTEDLFAAHATACAATKAEARTLRKALMVKCLAAEELPANKNVAEIVKNSIKGRNTTGEIKTTDLMSDAQFNFIDSKCRQLDIDAFKYAKESGFVCSSLQDFRKLKKMEASNMIQKLNEYQSAGGIPDTILGYSAGWKE